MLGDRNNGFQPALYLLGGFHLYHFFGFFYYCSKTPGDFICSKHIEHLSDVLFIIAVNILITPNGCSLTIYIGNADFAKIKKNLNKLGLNW